MNNASAIRVVDGDGQRGSVGEPLTSPVVVEVTDGGGDPVAGVTVEFALISAGTGAEITPATAQTGADGRAQAFVLLGDKVGLQTGEARVTGGASPATTFAALAVTGTGGGTAPVAAFTWDCHELSCAFSDASTDDGTVTGWLWQFGDGSTSTERNPSHDYDASGSYSVTLTVTDDVALSDIASNQVTVTAPPPANSPPRAEFQVTCQDLRCTFVDQSDDPDGTVASWAWDFGDGSTSSERNPSHTYATAGRYTVLLTVTDDDGAADSKTHPAEPTAPPVQTNQPPHADFDIHCDHSVCVFVDKSTDDDGTIVSRQWSFGDGSSSTEQNPMHTYSQPGRYTVLLTVTDNDGASSTKDRRADVKK